MSRLRAGVSPLARLRPRHVSNVPAPAKACPQRAGSGQGMAPRGPGVSRRGATGGSGPKSVPGAPRLRWPWPWVGVAKWRCRPPPGGKPRAAPPCTATRPRQGRTLHAWRQVRGRAREKIHNATTLSRKKKLTYFTLSRFRQAASQVWDLLGSCRARRAAWCCFPPPFCIHGAPLFGVLFLKVTSIFSGKVWLH